MKLVIRNCKVLDPTSEYRNKRVDILIERGVITDIGKDLQVTKAQEITGKNLLVSVGWMDIGTHLGEPGHEHRETFESIGRAALAGGFTDLATMPDTVPTTQTKGQIKNLIDAGKSIGVDIHPMGALSKDLAGNEITEFVDMHLGGAAAFTDGLHPVKKGGLLLRALQYAKAVDGVVLHHSNDSSLSNEDLVHEGEVSAQIGMKGSPSMSESLMTYRDLQLHKYADSKLCLHLISTTESVTLIKKAKKKTNGLSVGVAYLNLVMDHTAVLSFDSNAKVLPILRSPSDSRSLQKAVSDDTIDYIATNHRPLEIEKKQLEYPYATHGAIGLETCFAALHTMSGQQIAIEQLVRKLTIGPRAVLGIANPSIALGSIAKLTIFDPTVKWTYTANGIKSKSQNSPFIGHPFVGRVVCTINGPTIHMAEI